MKQITKTSTTFELSLHQYYYFPCGNEVANPNLIRDSRWISRSFKVEFDVIQTTNTKVPEKKAMSECNTWSTIHNDVIMVIVQRCLPDSGDRVLPLII